MIVLDLEDTYIPTTASPDYMNYTFDSELRDGSTVEIIVEITDIQDVLLPNVYNLGFGPTDGNGSFDDKAKLIHRNSGKVFSTIILFGITFLQQYPGTTIGLDGSNDIRAILYHRMFRSNYPTLSEELAISGVDWYVRLLRNGYIELDGRGEYFFKPKPEPFDLQRSSKDLYRYYMIDVVV